MTGYPEAGQTRCWLALLVAAVLFSSLFAFPIGGFWVHLAASTLILGGMGLAGGAIPSTPVSVFRKRDALRVAAIGVALAAFLYAAFFIGRLAALWIIPGARDMIGEVYVRGDAWSRWKVALLLLVVVGPCEEIFWRGYVQRRLSDRYGWKGVVITAIAYTGVHLSSGNIVLLLAAGVCGVFWGLLFWRYRNLALNIVSHGVWAAAIFSVVPLR